MSHFSNLRDGELTELKRIMGEYFTAEQVRKINRFPRVMEGMYEAAMRDLVFRLIHGIWTPMSDVVEIAREYEGVTGDQIDAMLKTARDNGLIEGFERESDSRPLLAPVIVRNRESVPATFLYGRELMQKAWDGKYTEWGEAYAQGVDDDRVKLIPGARAFVPDELVLHIVDFGANWNRRDGLILEDIQKAQAGQLAAFEALFAASQHSEWLRQMDGKEVPYALMAALLLNVPGYDAWRCSPNVWHNGVKAELYGNHVEDRFNGHAMPVLREYKP